MHASKSKIDSVVDKILALRELTRTQGFRTTRTQNELLATLTDDELAEASTLLANCKS